MALKQNLPSPTDSYGLSDIDSAGNPTYFGFVNAQGWWYVKTVDSTGPVRYASGESDYSAAWTGRAGLTYLRFDESF